MLVGLPGAGKTTLAAAPSQRIPDTQILNKDWVRSALFEPCDYSAAERDIAFSAMLDAARYHLGRGRLVLLEGLAFPRAGRRTPSTRSSSTRAPSWRPSCATSRSRSPSLAPTPMR